MGERLNAPTQLSGIKAAAEQVPEAQHAVRPALMWPPPATQPDAFLVLSGATLLGSLALLLTAWRCSR